MADVKTSTSVSRIPNGLPTDDLKDGLVKVGNRTYKFQQKCGKETEADIQVSASCDKTIDVAYVDHAAGAFYVESDESQFLKFDVETGDYSFGERLKMFWDAKEITGEMFAYTVFGANHVSTEDALYLRDGLHAYEALYDEEYKNESVVDLLEGQSLTEDNLVEVLLTQDPEKKSVRQRAAEELVHLLSDNNDKIYQYAMDSRFPFEIQLFLKVSFVWRAKAGDKEKLLQIISNLKTDKNLFDSLTHYEAYVDKCIIKYSDLAIIEDAEQLYHFATHSDSLFSREVAGLKYVELKGHNQAELIQMAQDENFRYEVQLQISQKLGQTIDPNDTQALYALVRNAAMNESVQERAGHLILNGLEAKGKVAVKNFVMDDTIDFRAKSNAIDWVFYKANQSDIEFIYKIATHPKASFRLREAACRVICDVYDNPKDANAIFLKMACEPSLDPVLHSVVARHLSCHSTHQELKGYVFDENITPGVKEKLIELMRGHHRCLILFTQNELYSLIFDQSLNIDYSSKSEMVHLFLNRSKLKDKNQIYAITQIKNLDYDLRRKAYVFYLISETDYHKNQATIRALGQLSEYEQELFKVIEWGIRLFCITSNDDLLAIWKNKLPHLKGEAKSLALAKIEKLQQEMDKKKPDQAGLYLKVTG